MRRPAITGIMRLLAAIFWMTMLFPFLVIAGALAEGSISLFSAFCGQAGFVLLACLGALFSRALQNHRLSLGLLRPPCALACAAAGFLVTPFPAFSPVTALTAHILFSVLCAAAFVAGTMLYFYSYARLHAGMPVVWLIVTHVGGSAVLWALSQIDSVQYRPDPLVFSVVLAFTAYALCRNQANIDFHMERRRHRMELLPQKIRAYNLRLMLAVLAAVPILFVLRSQIAEGLRTLGWWLATFFAWVFFLIVKLVELIHGEEAPAAGGMNEAALLAPFQNQPYEIISDFWFYLAFTLISAALLWWKRRDILRLLLSVFRKLWGLICRLFSFSSASHWKGGEPESPYYTDEVVSLSPEQERLRRTAKRPAAREWRRAYGRYLHMPEDSEEKRSEKFRAGYRLVLQYLAANGCYASSDTVHELEKRALSLPGMQEYSAAADSYDQVRYGECAPSTEDFSSLQHTLAGMAGQGFGKKGR